jgi:hypothetical protein
MEIMERMIHLLSSWVAKDSKKEYPHGYGFIEPIVIATESQFNDMSKLLETVTDIYGEGEFECIALTAVDVIDLTD